MGVTASVISMKRSVQMPVERVMFSIGFAPSVPCSAPSARYPIGTSDSDEDQRLEQSGATHGRQ